MTEPNYSERPEGTERLVITRISTHVRARLARAPRSEALRIASFAPINGGSSSHRRALGAVRGAETFVVCEVVLWKRDYKAREA